MDQSQYETPVQVIRHRYGVFWELEFVTVNTQVTVPSGDDRREPQRLNLWQSPSPVSGSWREEANDAGVSLEDLGQVCPGGLYGSLW